MSIDAFYDSSFILKSLLVYPSTGAGTMVDLTYNFIEVNLFEDLFCPACSGSILVGDALDLIARVPLLGFEYLSVKYGKPGDDSADVEKVFRIYKIEAPNFEKGSQSAQTYIIRFCSEELLLSATIAVSKSYKGKSVSDAITDLLKNQLKVQKKMTIDPTTGIFDYIIPFWHPFEAINWLSSRSIPPTVFYESLRDGFCFKKIQNLVSVKPKKAYVYYPANIPPPDSTFTKVLNFEHVGVLDVLKGIKNGMFASSLTTVDLTRLQFNDTTFSLKDWFNSNPSLGQGSFFNGLQDRFGQDVTQRSSGVRRFVPTTTGFNTDPLITGSQPGLQGNLVEQWLLQRGSQLEQLDYFKMKFLLPGDMSISVGDAIQFTLPSASIKIPNNNEANINPHYSGNYLLSALHHKITPKAYEIIALGLKDSVNEAYPDATNQDATLSTMRNF